MGQAFDGDGNVLGEAYGATKREVFEKLDAAHKNAAEIRIKSLAREREQRLPPGDLPVYRCHKLVRAAQIHGVETSPSFGLSFGEGHGVEVTEEWYDRHKPQVGGYYVVYEDGYASYSPAEAFESGYTAEPSADPAKAGAPA